MRRIRVGYDFEKELTKEMHLIIFIISKLIYLDVGFCFLF